MYADPYVRSLLFKDRRLRPLIEAGHLLVVQWDWFYSYQGLPEMPVSDKLCM